MLLASARVRQRGAKVRKGCSESFDLTNPSSVVQLQNAIGVLRNALGKCKSEADRSESAIGVLKHALRICKSEADRSKSAIGVFKKCPKTFAGSPRPSRDIALRSPLLLKDRMCDRGARFELLQE